MAAVAARPRFHYVAELLARGLIQRPVDDAVVGTVLHALDGEEAAEAGQDAKRMSAPHPTAYVVLRRGWGAPAAFAAADTNTKRYGMHKFVWPVRAFLHRSSAQMYRSIQELHTRVSHALERATRTKRAAWIRAAHVLVKTFQRAGATIPWDNAGVEACCLILVVGKAVKGGPDPPTTTTFTILPAALSPAVTAACRRGGGEGAHALAVTLYPLSPHTHPYARVDHELNPVFEVEPRALFLDDEAGRRDASAAAEAEGLNQLAEWCWGEAEGALSQTERDAVEAEAAARVLPAAALAALRPCDDVASALDKSSVKPTMFMRAKTRATLFHLQKGTAMSLAERMRRMGGGAHIVPVPCDGRSIRDLAGPCRSTSTKS